MSPINVGILGYGASITIFHLPFILLNPDLNVIAFLQRKEAPQGEAAVEPGTNCIVDYPNAKHYRQVDEFWTDQEIELVIVCASSERHAALAEKALLAGKHVVVEKPFTVTSAEADKLTALAKQQGKALTCFQNRRYDSDFLTLQHLVKIGSFGQITEFENRYDMDNPPWI
ncbi:Putative gfo/Idh/MocA-like oxidoreductase, NAD(P)-binding domain superfamily [Acrodontium crateriforme]|uniref:Gfo/Idh/MocA-like oxidoreductase, NAD(P)-binding domain superfamily n=1 Tax=Acrodontium crateriforme TaxID=150365 RepID=A0AAQ3R6H7_9PEZI|nr:Putative gfo/Idh/MocA-like oxidoreductase, NAD(P)-binding domain superfamily [Acrodontium crateriforme]